MGEAMNDVKDFCEQILQTTPPPMRDSTQVLQAARHAAQRRSRITVAACGMATAAIVAIAAAANLTSPAPRLPGPQTAASRPAVSPPRVPDRAAAHAHGDRIAQILASALPPGYTTRP